MNFICEKETIIKAINSVINGVASKTTMPILEGILIQTNDNEIKLTSYDLEIGIEYIINATVKEQGNTVVNATMFSEIITMLSDAGIFSLLAKGSIVLIILFIASFIAYAITAAILASMTTNIEDFQQLQTPLMIIMLVGYYVALMSVMFDGSIFIHILSFIPLLSVMVAPTLYLIGEISLLSLALSTLITVIVTYFLYKYGLRIYKVGILNYSSSKLWRKMFKSLGNKE